MLEGASMESMTLKGAAEYLNISKNRIWRAVKDGHLAAEEGKVKGQTAFLVTSSDLESWAQEWLSPEELETAIKHPETPSKHSEAPPEHLEAPFRHLETPHGYLEVFEGVYEAPEGASSRSKAVSGNSSLREDLVGALERSHQELRQVERRAIELELQLRQHKMLLTENAESLLEREALVKEAEAKLQASKADRQTELERLAALLNQAPYGPVASLPGTPAFTTIGGLFEKGESFQQADPYAVPQSWLAARAQLDPAVPFNFISTPDITGGNSGSPVVNTAGELVGLIFDGNLPSLVLDFRYEDTQARAVSVDARAITQALTNVYDAGFLVEEISR